MHAHFPLTSRRIPFGQEGQLVIQTFAGPDLDQSHDRAAQRAEAMAVLRRMRALPADAPARSRLREQLIAEHMNFARHLARRYVRGDQGAREDLEQVAYLGLVKAVDGFDPEYGTGFPGYAAVMILGEIKRHYRDATWAVHVPRRMQELTRDLHRAADVLTARLGESPTIAQLAEHLGAGPEEVVEALEASAAYRTASLDRPVGAHEDSAPMRELIGQEDPGFDAAVDRHVLRGLIAELDARDKRILLMRFFRDMTQAEIGAELGVTQMQVSRILASLLGQLRAGFG